MTTQPRRRGGQSKAAADKADTKATESTPADAAPDGSAAKREADAVEQVAAEETETVEGNETRTDGGGHSTNVDHEGHQPAEDETPEAQAEDGGSGAGNDETAVARATAATQNTLQPAGDPEPATVDASMVRPETGFSPEVEQHDVVPTAATGDGERNGAPRGIGTDLSGDLRRQDGAVATAAHGQDARNGHETGMYREGQLDDRFGGNGDSVARLAGDGVRGEVGVGTANPDIGPDLRPQYPSTTLTRSSPSAAPMEPEDVRYATQPKLGDVASSLDPTMAAAQMPSMPGDTTKELVDRRGNAVVPSEFFEVPEGPAGRNLRRVKHRVSEVFTVQKSRTPGQRLLFTEGQMVPVEVAQTLIELHG